MQIILFTWVILVKEYIAIHYFPQFSNTLYQDYKCILGYAIISVEF
jgi:hypothetical protein